MIEVRERELTMISKLKPSIAIFSMSSASLVCGAIACLLGICSFPLWDGAAPPVAKGGNKKPKFELTHNLPWDAYDSQGQVFFNQGQYERTESYFERALEVAKPNSMQQLISLQKLSLLNHIMGNIAAEDAYDQRLLNFGQSFNVSENMLDQSSLSKASDLMLRAQNSSSSGRQPPISIIYPKKAPLLREALLLRQQSLPPQSKEVTESLSELIWMDGAWFYQATESPVAYEHEALLRQLIATMEQNRARDKNSSMESAVQALEDLGTRYTELAYVLFRKHDDKNAATYWKKAFLIFQNAQRRGVIPYPGVTMPELVRMSKHLASKTESAQMMQIVCPGYVE